MNAYETKQLNKKIHKDFLLNWHNEHDLMIYYEVTIPRRDYTARVYDYKARVFKNSTISINGGLLYIHTKSMFKVDCISLEDIVKIEVIK